MSEIGIDISGTIGDKNQINMQFLKKSLTSCLKFYTKKY